MCSESSIPGRTLVAVLNPMGRMPLFPLESPLSFVVHPLTCTHEPAEVVCPAVSRGKYVTLGFHFAPLFRGPGVHSMNPILHHEPVEPHWCHWHGCSKYRA